MSISGWMDKKVVVHIHNGVLLSHSKEYVWISSDEVDETGAYYSEWSKPEREILSSVQSLSRVRLFVTPWIAARQASLFITSSWSYPNSCPLSWWCHPAISSSVIPFSSCSQSLPASGSFRMSQLISWGGQSTEVSASTSVLPMNTQDWSPLRWTGWISLQSKGLSKVFSNTTVQNHQFFSTQLSLHPTHIHTWLLEKPQPWLDGPLLTK